MTTGTVWRGGALGDQVRAVLAPNPGPMTLDGTNTWILHVPGDTVAAVVDPGPLHEGHLQEVLRQVGARGARVALTLVTHWHHDHTESLERWAELTQAPVRGGGRGPDFADDERISLGSLQIRVLLTPGHTADSVSFHLPDAGALLTGDTVLGRGTTVVAHPDGALGPYLASLDKLHAVAAAHPTALAPAHGPTHADAATVIAAYRQHRAERLDQVRAALAAGDDEATDVAQAVVERVYADVPREVWPAAKWSVQAQLDYLAANGQAG
ncbi:MBL fold metallo-hydrolase [Flexivirga caeni]|uniref:MBL fold metallo-hydrolase n=1 Tax=Flexivirga caeni TaxID=2294115 RepID=A0A3M9LYC8_9MICO|nr:MBL fold metallo-hydrolase [Flexivirga caeni]RNI18296.1 MBL fold metallo-hydrolase [Flexivirga caeni]